METIKSAETLLAELRTFLRAYNASLDTGDGSLSKDLLLTPFSIGGKLIMDQVTIARDLHVLSRLEDGQIDDEGTNYKKERLPGSYATVTLTFFTEILSTSDIVIPAGTTVKTAGTTLTSPITFETVSEARFSVGDIATYYSYDNARYEFTVTAICTTIGTGGNVGQNTISSIVGTVSGISGVTNINAATGGLSSETDEDMKVRISLAKLGRDLNVPNGVRGLMKDNGFLDAYTVRVEDADAERATGIDVFVVNTITDAAIETFTYYPGRLYYFTNRPVTEVTSVKVASTGVTLASSLYAVNIDNTSPLRRSVYAQDYIQISAFTSLSPGQLFTVSYNYASRISRTQDNVNLVENHVLTADLLIKRAYPVYLYLNATLTLKTSSDGPATRSRCRNAIAQFMSSYRLGESLQKSDLILVLQQGYGDYSVDTVDAVRITSYYLKDEFGNSYLPIDETITIGKKYYIVYGNTVLV